MIRQPVCDRSNIVLVVRTKGPKPAVSLLNNIAIERHNSTGTEPALAEDTEPERKNNQTDVADTEPDRSRT